MVITVSDKSFHMLTTSDVNVSVREGMSTSHDFLRQFARGLPVFADMNLKNQGMSQETVFTPLSFDRPRQTKLPYNDINEW